jgi:two-component system sensor histidine kinase FlrB
MTSLPTAIPSPAGPELIFGENERFLREAFCSFAEAAGSLERSYGMLRTEVGRLHGELAQSNAGLARSLEENRAMRERLDRILDGLPCGVLVTGANGDIRLLNPEGRRLLRSVTVAEAVTPVTDDAADPNSVSRFEPRPLPPGELRELLDRARSETAEQEHCFHEHSFQEHGSNDGRRGECWLAVRHAAVPSSDVEGGGNAGSIFILRDVSEAKRMVREREKLRREQALAEMSAILAHEIRNPLGSLELFASLLAEAGLSAECRQWVEHVQAGLRTLAATVNNVLHFHSLPAPDRVPTDLGRLLDWAGGFLVPMARQARVELCLRNRLQGVWLSADRHRLEQVLLNLVLNALRAMPGGGWVEVAGQRIRDGNVTAVAICVSDTGPGIRPEHAARIFEPGFSTRPGGGPGLGLAVCQKIVEQHGGWLHAANREGRGACFTLTFPLQEESCQEESFQEQSFQEESRQEVAG